MIVDDVESVHGRSAEALFTPFAVNSLKLPNRIVMSPMGRLHCANGLLDPAYVPYYRRRAEGGTSLIIGEAAGIDPVSLSLDQCPFFFGEALDTWRQICAAVHEAGGFFMPQIWHAGLSRKPGTNPNGDQLSIGPSGLFLPHVGADFKPKPDYKANEPMTHAEIDEVIESFARAAVEAWNMGADGVNIHGAHGYLIDEFFWSRSNKRTDKYGGSLANRVRFAVEIVQEVRGRTAPDFPIFFRLSQWKTQDYGAKIARDPTELAAILEPLAEAGVDLFDCSTRRFWEPEFEGSDLNLAGWAKKLTGVATMTVGSVGLDGDFMTTTDEGGKGAYLEDNAEADLSVPASLDKLLDRLERKEFDLVAVGRALIANPEWTNIIRDGEYHRLKPYSRKDLLTLV